MAPCAFIYPAASIAAGIWGALRMMNFMWELITALGNFVILQIRGIGKLTLFSLQVLQRIPASLSRLYLVVAAGAFHR